MKFVVILACILALSAEAKPKTESNAEVTALTADQDVAESHRSGYFGGYSGYWRGRRSVVEVQPEHEANLDVADQEANEFFRGYYGGHRGYWRGRRSVEEKKQEEETNLEAGHDLNVNEWYGSRYYGYPNGYGRYGHWRGRRSAVEMKPEQETDVKFDDDLSIDEWYARRYYGYPYSYDRYGYRGGYYW